MEYSGTSVGAGGARIFGATRGELDETLLVGSVYGAGGGALGAYYRAVELYNKQVESACAGFSSGTGRMEAARFCAECYVRPVWYGSAIDVGRASELPRRGGAGVGGDCLLDDSGVFMEGRRGVANSMERRLDVGDDAVVGRVAEVSGVGNGCYGGLRKDVAVDEIGQGVDVLSGRVLEKSEGNIEVGEGSSMVGGGSARGHSVREFGTRGDGTSGRVSGGCASVGMDVNLLEGNRGKNWRKNQRKSANRKLRNRDREVNVDTGLRDDDQCSEDLGYSKKVNADAGPEFDDRRLALRLSLENKWVKENELKAAKAARELELLRSEDLEAVKKLREKKIRGATEKTMVQIEKAHASLIQTGNVPGVQPAQGFCQTVVDGEVVESVPGLSSGESKECSISPSSSISEREVRNMMKELEDLREENKRYRRKEGLGERVSRMYSESVPVTLDDEGCVPEDIKELAADRFEGHGFFKYGKVFEKDGKKYKTMKFDAEGYSYSGIENWYD